MSEYPKRDFGEINLVGGLHNFKQTMRFKYLYPTRDYPQGKAVIELLVPEQINNILIPKEMLEKVQPQIMDMVGLLERTNGEEDKAIIANQLRLLKAISEAKSKARPFAVKSFRFTEKDYMSTQNMLSHLGHLFGYLFCKYKMEVETSSNIDMLIQSRNVVAQTNGEKVAKEFLKGFMDSYNEIDAMKLKKVRQEAVYP